MPATVLISQYYDGVRGLIAPEVTAEHISDDYLSQRPFAPEAERKVRKRLNAAGIDVDSLTGDALEDARLAMMHECAAVLCLTAPQQLRQTLIAVQTQNQQVDWKEKRAFHLSEANDLMNDVIENTDTAETGSASTQRKRRNPFGAVGTERKEVETPRYPYRRVYTDR